MSYGNPPNQPPERLRENLRLQRIAARAAKDAQHRASEMHALSILVAAIQRPESAGHRDALLDALGRMADVCLINATIAKEGIEIACAGSLEFGGSGDLMMLPDARATHH